TQDGFNLTSDLQHLVKSSYLSHSAPDFIACPLTPGHLPSFSCQRSSRLKKVHLPSSAKLYPHYYQEILLLKIVGKHFIVKNSSNADFKLPVIFCTKGAHPS
uniref:Uncharacterized protein n=1 Tax=Cyanoderma ruficeps TaxID=181631 RepID=A0A8C3QKW4_9PASS